MNNLKYISVLIMLALTVAACKKDEAPEDHHDDDHTHSTSGPASMMLHHQYGTQSFALNQNYTDGFGNVLYFTTAAFYVSEPTLLDMSGNMAHEFSSNYHLVTPDVNSMSFGELEAGHYHSIVMNIGVDSMANHADPSLYATDHALAPKSPSMHWGWNPGYKFILLEGMVDTDSDGTPDTNFAYHIGTDALYRSTPAVEIHAESQSDTGLTLHFNVDYSAFLDGINVATDPSTHTNNNLPLATTMADNVGGLFSVH